MSEQLIFEGFRITVIDKDEVWARFKVEEITGRTMDNEIYSTEPYLECTIKWDSCSHFWFGDEDGYLHLCGVSDYKQHIKLMEWLYKKAFELMGRRPSEGYEWSEG